MYNRYRKGNIIKAKVTGITKYGIFVKVDDKYDGLIHISAISEKFVKDPGNFASVNDYINAEILEFDKKAKKMKLSIKNLRYKDRKFVDRKIVETEHGFGTLKKNLPNWINKNIKSEKNIDKFVDKH